MFASNQRENRRLYRYPTQPNASNLLTQSNILKEVTNSHDNNFKSKLVEEIASPEGSYDFFNSEQKENFSQHITNPSVVIKNAQQTYQAMLDVMAQYQKSNQSHSHSNSNGSTLSHVRSASDADSVIFLGPEESSRIRSGTSSDSQSLVNQNWEDIQVKSPDYLARLKYQQKQFQTSQSMSSKTSTVKSQRNVNSSNKADDTFNLSVSNEMVGTFPTIISESQQVSCESFKQNKNTVSTAPQCTTGITNENEQINNQITLSSPKKNLYFYCNICKTLTTTENYQVQREQKLKSGMLSLIIEVICCMNSKNNFQRKNSIGIRCSQCKQTISKMSSFRENQ